MSDALTLNAEPRSDVGKGASRRLRRAGVVPAIVYGGGEPPASITLQHNDVDKSLQNEAFYSSILTLNLEGTGVQAIIKDMQRHPYRRQVMHMDFLRVREDQEIQVNVPLHFIGEDVCVGVKTGGGTISHVQTEVAVACLPKDLPEYMEVDLSEVELGSTVHLSDIVVPEGVRLVELSYGAEHDAAVATVQIMRVIEEEDELAEGEEGIEGEAEGDADDAGGESESGETPPE